MQLGKKTYDVLKHVCINVRHTVSNSDFVLLLSKNNDDFTVWKLFDAKMSYYDFDSVLSLRVLCIESPRLVM